MTKAILQNLKILYQTMPSRSNRFLIKQWKKALKFDHKNLLALKGLFSFEPKTTVKWILLWCDDEQS